MAQGPLNYPSAVAPDTFQQHVGGAVAIAIAHQARRQIETRLMIIGVGGDL